MEPDWEDSGIEEGDVVVVGNRPEVQCALVERGVELLILSNGPRRATTC